MGLLPGIGASLVAALLFWVGTEFVFPKLWGAVKRGPGNISGTWATYDSDVDGAARAGWARVTQLGSRVRIEVTRERKRDGKDMRVPRIFRYEGRFSSGNLAAIFKDKNADYAVGAVVLHYSPAEGKLSGKTMYYDDDGNGVGAHEFYLRRN